MNECLLKLWLNCYFAVGYKCALCGKMSDRSDDLCFPIEGKAL